MRIPKLVELNNPCPDSKLFKLTQSLKVNGIPKNLGAGGTNLR